MYRTIDICDAGEIDLRLSLIGCGQCFRWIEWNGCFGSVIGDVPVWLFEENGRVKAYAGGNMDMRHYLGLDLDYGKIFSSLRDSKALMPYLKSCPGLRVLNQPIWDTLVTFLVSSNNNIKRIMKTCHELARLYGKPFDPPREFARKGAPVIHSIPSPAALANVPPAELRAIGTGYRDEYLVRTARLVSEGTVDITGLASLSFDEAHKRLCSLHGVGDKVADCVLLFGAEHYEAIPVDVWIDRALHSILGIVAPNRKKLGALARERLGPYAGIVQQFMFHGMRVIGDALMPSSITA